jgi:two-component system sensor histidine kinase SenX3
VNLISKRKKAKAEAAEVNAFEKVASQIVDVLASAGVVLDSYNSALRASPGAVQMGLVQNRRLVHEELIALVEKARLEPGTFQAEVRLETGLGKQELWVLARAARFGEHYVMLLVDDRTESKKLEETRRDFVANVSHELKTPVGAIGLLAEAISSSLDDAQMLQKFSNSMQVESQRLASLVQDLIELSRVQVASLTKVGGAINLQLVVKEAVKRNETLALQRKINVSASALEPVEIFGDYEMLVTATRNLIENAILYSNPRGHVGVGLRVVEGVAEISVTDSGIGIPEAEQLRIFERFYRVDPSRSRETGGTGLGLAIVNHAASNHLGEVKLFSKAGIGSTFTLRLPMETKDLE